MYTVDSSTDYDEFTTFIKRRTPLPQTHLIHYLDNHAQWIPLINETTYQLMASNMPTDKPQAIYVLPKPTAKALPSPPNPVEALSILEDLSAAPTILDEILVTPTTIEKPPPKTILPAAASLDSPTPPIQDYLDSAATSQTLDFLTTPALTPNELATPPPPANPNSILMYLT